MELLQDEAARVIYPKMWSAVAVLVAVAVASGIADARRTRRRDPDRVGWVDWPKLQFAAMLGALIVAALAITA